jgi:hypothetical protein
VGCGRRGCRVDVHLGDYWVRRDLDRFEILQRRMRSIMRAALETVVGIIVLAAAVAGVYYLKKPRPVMNNPAIEVRR